MNDDTSIPAPPDTPMPDTGPESIEVFDPDRALKTILYQVASIFQTLPKLVAAVDTIGAQQAEHERRIIRLEGIGELQKDHERRIIRLEGTVEKILGIVESLVGKL